MTLPTPFGFLRVEFTTEAVTASAWEDGEPEPDAGRPGALGRAIRAQVARYVAGGRAGFTLPLAYAGTAFEAAVWRAAARIPHGATASYGEVARAIGRAGAHRAVARAMGRSPFALLLPAHRVVGADGSVRGAGPDSRRARLLAFERTGALG